MNTGPVAPPLTPDTIPQVSERVKRWVGLLLDGKTICLRTGRTGDWGDRIEHEGDGVFWSDMAGLTDSLWVLARLQALDLLGPAETVFGKKPSAETQLDWLRKVAGHE